LRGLNLGLPNGAGATGVQAVTRVQSLTTDEGLILIGLHMVARKARAGTLNGIPEISGAYLSFELHKEAA
jgi:hypothetical protein